MTNKRHRMSRLLAAGRRVSFQQRLNAEHTSLVCTKNQNMPQPILKTHRLKPSIRSKYQDGKPKFFAGAAIRSTYAPSAGRKIMWGEI